MMLTMGREVLDSQPFSVLLGARLTAFEPGQVELVVPLRAELLQQHGFVHGGVLSYVADNALTFAGGSALGQRVVTAGYTISYLKPAQGDRLIARATVVATGKRQAVCRCDVFVATSADEYLCAVAQGTIMTMGVGD
jgi:uncharacterized protein (TIGR00369 family)